MVLKNAFTLVGNKRLVKVIANTPHNAKVDNDTQYPQDKAFHNGNLLQLYRQGLQVLFCRVKLFVTSIIF
ncbi:MAG: hypothetical protein IPF72_16260 [Chitinophagaceae bacterium]|nr:hypothetical protein [Chitinophagaceae bacterium]